MLGTLAPSPWFTGLDANGKPYAAGKLYTYAAGTTNNQATYNNADLDPAHVNTNPIILDGAGRCVIYLSATSYRFDLYTSAGALVRTQDNIAAVPTAAGNVDEPITAGEALTAGMVAYESDGSGGKTQGLWYKADAATPYSSLYPNVGFVVSDIAINATGTIRKGGQIGSQAGLTAGVPYFIGTAGAVASAPAGHYRLVGWAVSTTVISILLQPSSPSEFDVLGVAAANAPTASAAGHANVWLDTTKGVLRASLSAAAADDLVRINPAVTCGRLTLTSATPVTTGDVTAATTLYFALYAGNRIALFNGQVWVLDALTELSIAVPGTTSTMYDAFVYDNAGTPTLELLAWTNDTTRATALTTQNGVLVKSGVTTRKFVGSFRTTTVSGQTEDSATKRYVSNYYNSKRKPLVRQETTTTWTYNTATIRQANAAAANQIDFVIGWAEVTVDAHVQVSYHNAGGGGVTMAVGLGLDSTTTFSGAPGASASQGSPLTCNGAYRAMPAAGRHFLSWNELVAVSGAATTFYAAGGGGALPSSTSGIDASFDC